MGNTTKGQAETNAVSIDNLSIETPILNPNDADVLAAPRRRTKSAKKDGGEKEEAESDFDDSGDEEDPHAHGMGGDLTSAILGIIKGMVGPAILYLPHGFATAGFAIALPTLIISTAMYLYSSRCLLVAWKVESARDNAVRDDEDGEALLAVTPRRKRRALSYPELANRALGPRGEAVVKTGIALMQSGVCLTYLIFVPHNLHSSMEYLFNVDVSPQIWLIIMIIIQIPLSWIRDITKLTCTNFTANCLILYGLILCLGFAFEEATKSDDMSPLESIYDRVTHLEPFEDKWFLFIGTSVSDIFANLRGGILQRFSNPRSPGFTF